MYTCTCMYSSRTCTCTCILFTYMYYVHVFGIYYCRLTQSGKIDVGRRDDRFIDAFTRCKQIVVRGKLQVKFTGVCDLSENPWLQIISYMNSNHRSSWHFSAVYFSTVVHYRILFAHFRICNWYLLLLTLARVASAIFLRILIFSMLKSM